MIDIFSPVFQETKIRRLINQFCLENNEMFLYIYIYLFFLLSGCTQYVLYIYIIVKGWEGGLDFEGR